MPYAYQRFRQSGKKKPVTAIAITGYARVSARPSSQKASQQREAFLRSQY
jgi:hypothetical protein